MKDGKIQWHPAFGAALRIELADELSPQDIGITFVCNHYPRKMLKHIQDVRGITVKKCEEGIYELSGDPIPMQLIITHELTKEKNYWMQSLRNNLHSGGEIRDLIDAYDKKKTQPLYQAVMDVILQANWKEAEVEKEMCETLRKLFAEELEEEKRNGVKQGITALVKAAYDWKMPKHEVIQKIVEEFQITGSEAENFVKAYYK
ncbi:MAG: hypothetical protein MR406_04165 [Blautia sp.]|nr:hypothetical protein [Blautia sp.]